jgi:hypothetical protein
MQLLPFILSNMKRPLYLETKVDCRCHCEKNTSCAGMILKTRTSFAAGEGTTVAAGAGGGCGKRLLPWNWRRWRRRAEGVEQRSGERGRIQV